MLDMNEFRSRLLALHDPEAPKAQGMACQFWQDGEVTLQKGGTLLWQRNLHMIRMGFKGLDLNLPEKSGPDSYIWVKDFTQATELNAELEANLCNERNFPTS